MTFPANKQWRKIPDGVLNVAVSEVILNEPGICALVGQGEAASVAEHVRMGAQGQRRGCAVFLQEKIDGRAVQGLALFADKKRPASRLHPRALFQPCADSSLLIAS